MTEPSLKPGAPYKAGEFVRVPVGTLEAGGWPKDPPSGTFRNPGMSRALRRTVDMEANRAALPKPPAYARPKTYQMK